jgi:HlyD family secretion protein
VVEVAADFNQTVTEGDLLFRLDDEMASEKLRQAELAILTARTEGEQASALAEAARKVADRLRSLPASVSLRKDLDPAEAQQKAAEARVRLADMRVKEAEEARKLAELNLRLTRVHVPVITRPAPPANVFRGLGKVGSGDQSQRTRRQYVVLDRQVEVNQLVGPPASARLFTLAGDLKQMQVHAQVAEGDIGRVCRGQRVDFTVADVSFSGQVADLRLLPATDRGAVFYKVIIDVTNSRDPSSGEWRLRPGMTASVDIVTRRHDNVWKVPLSALSVDLEVYKTPEARARLARGQTLSDKANWQPVWVIGHEQKPWPIFVRLGNTTVGNEGAIQDDQYAEVLEWDPEWQPKPGAKGESPPPPLITGVVPMPKNSWINLPRIKI